MMTLTKNDTASARSSIALIMCSQLPEDARDTQLGLIHLYKILDLFIYTTAVNE